MMRTGRRGCKYEWEYSAGARNVINKDVFPQLLAIYGYDRVTAGSLTCFSNSLEKIDALN